MRLLAAAWFIALPLAAFAVSWPQEIVVPEGTLVVYQPQPEKLVGDLLTGRAAISFEPANKAEPIFGAMWFSARIDTDRDENTARVRSVKVTEIRWPESTDEKEAKVSAVIQNAVPKVGFEVSMDQLTASLATAEVERKSLSGIKNEAPKIVFSEELAVLMLYDGEPKFVAVPNHPYERALNVPFAVARENATKKVYVSSGEFWFEAASPLGPFTPTTSPPPELVKMLPTPDADEAAPEESKTAPNTPPKIVVAITPTELISTSGKPNWKALPGGKLLYVDNTETPWLRDAADQQMYLLLSGRWFRSKIAAGPWSFVRPDQLPAAFKDIPPDSDLGGIRSSIAGTEEADEAVRDAAIPQTAAILRSEARLDVTYDGTPKFEKIAGTAVSYAVNSGTQVLEIKSRFYAVDNGVWFTAPTARGPWVVADKVPQEEIDKIPPSTPVYNTTYVHIYESTPEVVYVGYTPGYMWSFPYYGVPVYGTGWYYPPYWGGGMYYPRPPTWGMHVGYNPWTGWYYGVSWSNGFFTIGIGWTGGWGSMYPPYGCCGGWYGGGYRPPQVAHHGNIGIGGVNGGNRINTGDVRRPGGAHAAQNNLYQRPETRARVADRVASSRDFQQARPSTGRANNVMADRSGQIARRNGNGWDVRNNGGWGGAGASTRPSIDRGDLNRGYSARQNGMNRQMRRPMTRPSGGMRRR